MLPPQVKAINNQIEKAIDKAGRSAEDRCKRNEKAERSVIVAIHPLRRNLKPTTQKVDTWAAKQDDEPTRSEAIRRLVELGLKAKGK
jgi:hypothetical protein